MARRKAESYLGGHTVVDGRWAGFRRANKQKAQQRLAKELKKEAAARLREAPIPSAPVPKATRAPLVEKRLREERKRIRQAKQAIFKRTKLVGKSRKSKKAPAELRRNSSKH